MTLRIVKTVDSYDCVICGKTVKKIKTAYEMHLIDQGWKFQLCDNYDCALEVYRKSKNNEKT